MIDWMLYLAARTLIGILRSLPLTFVAQVGRVGGAIFYMLDARHRRVAGRNIARCFPEKQISEVRAIARENFKRIGEAFASAAKTAYMTVEEILPRCELIGLEKLRAPTFCQFRIERENGKPRRLSGRHHVSRNTATDAGQTFTGHPIPFRNAIL